NRIPTLSSSKIKTYTMIGFYSYFFLLVVFDFFPLDFVDFFPDFLLDDFVVFFASFVDSSVTSTLFDFLEADFVFFFVFLFVSTSSSFSSSTSSSSSSSTTGCFLDSERFSSSSVSSTVSPVLALNT